MASLLKKLLLQKSNDDNKKSTSQSTSPSLAFDHKFVKRRDIQNLYQQKPSFANFLPWMEYDKASGCFLLEDGLSVAILFELEDIACEARSIQFFTDLRDRLQRLFQDTLPQEEHSPWILQFYLQDEPNLEGVANIIKNYAKESLKESQLTRKFTDLMSDHYEFVTRSGGLFKDVEVSGQIFQGKRRRIRLVVYRKLQANTKIRRGRSIIQDANAVAKNIVNQLQNCGVIVKRMNGNDFYHWMKDWFGNKDNKINKKNKNNNFYPDELPFGYDFAEQIFHSIPESDEEKGIWIFDKIFHKYITVQGLSQIPVIGHLSAEREHSKNWYALFDTFPEGSVFTLTIVIEDQNTVRNHVKRIIKSAVGDGIEALAAYQDCQIALKEIEYGNYLFPVVMGVYLKADSISSLLDQKIDVEVLLTNNGLKPIRSDVDLTPLDAYLRYLPMCYDYTFDKKNTYRSRYIYGRQIANLLPLYGRYRGTGRPGLSRFNRGGEPFFFDPLSTKDKSFNSHMLYFGSTGSGKSSTLVNDLLQVMAIYKPRLFILEAGNSFGLLADYFQNQGLSVNRVQLKRSQPVALNPFADGLRFLDSIGNLSETAISEIIESEENKLEKTLDAQKDLAKEEELTEIDEERDILGEMAIAAQLMITGGEEKEEARMTRQDRLLILKSISHAAKIAKGKNAKQMLAEHVVLAMREMADDINKQQGSTTEVSRLREMANGMDFFCTDELSARFFNTPGDPWPDADVTVLDMGIMAGKGYETQLAVAVMGVLNRIASIAEANQYDERMVLLVTDESHILTKNPLTAAQYTKASKMSRKLGWWLWFGTQNMSDFPDECRKMLSMIEFWNILGTSDAEIEEIKRFKPITEEQHKLLLSIKKEIGKYTEGVILSPKVTGLYRVVLPKLAFALAQTEKTEKSARMKIMQELNVSEIEAAEEIARRMMDQGFYE